VIGIAGDSGSGKDTFSGALTTLFGQQSVVSLSGDDYHLWDRHKPMWQVMTHLNPLANNLQGFANDLLLLISGKGIYKKHYNHVSGKMSRPTFIKSNDIIIASGLHALYLPILRTSYHLSIYLDIDEQLRKIFKIARDTHARGHSIQKVLSSFERRESDSKKYIHPQKQFSDLVFCLLPIYQKNSSQDEFPKAFKLKVTFLNQFNEQDLVRILVGILGLNVDLNLDVETSRIEMLVDGDVLAEDLELISKMICPQILEFLDIKPKWADGMLGIMQLITLSHIHQSLIKRTI
jgi:uridine kinase